MFEDGHDAPVSISLVRRFDRRVRAAAAVAAALQAFVIIGIAGGFLPRLPFFEQIRPASNDESLLVVFPIQGPLDAADITTIIATTLKSELESSPIAGTAAMLGTWRIERSRKELPVSAATSLGKELRSLFVILGSQDGQTLNLSLVLTEPTLLIQDEELLTIGLRLDGSPITLSIPRDELSSYLIPVTVFLKGIQLYLSGDFQRAEDHFTTVITSSQQETLTARAHFLRGICRVRLGQVEPAERDYDKTLELGLDSPAVHWRRAQLLSLTHRFFEGGEEALEKAIELSGNSGQSYLVSGILTFEQMLQIPYFYSDMPDYFNRADDDLRVASEKEPLQPAPVLARASLHLRYGQVLSRDTENEVTMFLEDALLRIPDSVELQLLLSRVKFEYGHLDEAKSLLLKGVNNGERSGEFMIALATVHEASGDSVNALRYFTMFLDQPLEREGQWWERANTKVRIARLSGDSEASVFREIETSEAGERRDRFFALTNGWIGNIWNRDFFGWRSTEDFLLYILREATIIPQVTDRQSARSIFRSLLANNDGESLAGRLPLWCESDWGSGAAFLIVDSTDEQGFIGVRLESKPDGRVLRFEIEEDSSDLDFLFTCLTLRTDLEMVFSGE